MAAAGCSLGQGGTTYYVSPDGSDEGPGEEAEPWQTLQFAVTQLAPGDTLLVGDGVYTGPVALTQSGSEEDGFVTIKNKPGESPVIDGDGVSVPRGFAPLVAMRNVDYVRLEGFEIRNWVSNFGRRNPVGIFVSGSGSHIEIVGNDIHDIEARAETGGRDGHGIAAYGTSATAITDLVIQNNKVHDLILGTSEAVVVNGNVDGFVVDGNEVWNSDNIGIDIIGFEGKSPDPELDRARNGVVKNNLVYNIDTADNPSYNERNAGGIYVDGGRDILIENNIVHDSNMGIEIASEDGGGDTSYIIVRNNVVYNNHIVGLAMGGYDENRGRTEFSEIVGNTFVNNDTDQEGNGELLLQFDVSNNVITDNIFAAGEQGLLLGNPYTENEDNLVDHNLYFSTDTPIWEWRTERFDSWASYQAATGNDSASIVADPLFVDAEAGDYTLTKDSPGRGTGSDDGIIGADEAILTNAFRNERPSS